MQKTHLNAIYLSTLQQQNFIIALSKFFLYQNRDGSWGQGNIENKATLTSQAIQLMHALKIGHDDKAFRKATRWMEDNIKKGNPHWTTRLEIGLKIGEFEKLADDHHIDVFLSDLEVSLSSTNDSQKLDLFWHIIPTLIALFPHEKAYEKRTKKYIPHDKVIEHLSVKYEIFDDNNMAVGGQLNNTGLVALYLSTISSEPQYARYKKDSDKMINWLLSGKTISEKGIYWQKSRGITSYVLIDLVKCLPNLQTIAPLIADILRFLTPDEKGRIERDIITTYDTKLHSQPLYLMILSLRSLVEVMQKVDPQFNNNLLYEARTLHSNRLLFKLVHFFYYHRRQIPIVLTIVILMVGFIAYQFVSDWGILLLSVSLSYGFTLFANWIYTFK